MPLSMVTRYKDITPDEIALLQRQYKKSYFYSNQQNTQAHPKKLAIFDFDSTLFFSPLLSPTIWHPDLIKLATAESVYGPGWWRDIRSLDLGPIEELEPKAWKGFWNEPIVKEAKRCINDPNTMTVVLTGRRYHPFHLLIPTMLNSKGLQFDLIGLRPDPEQVSDNHWEVKNGQQQLTYNLTSSVFKSTMHFKTCFILNLIHNVPSVRQVTMWDDRTYHVNRFKQYLNTLRYEGLINKGRVVYVPGVRPKYNPSWEKRVIGHIMETHNKALLEHRQEGIKIGKIEQRMKWSDEADVIEEEDPLGHSSSERPLRLTPLPAATVIKLSKETTHYLRDVYQPIFNRQLEDKWRETVWNVCGGEEPEYFGDCVYLSQHVLSNNQIKVAKLGSEVKMKIIAYSDSNDLACLLLKVQVEGYDEEDFLLPLWYKPSEYNELFKTTYYAWRRVKDDDKSISIINGKVDYAYRLGAVEKTISQKRPCQSHDNKKRLKKE